MGKQKFQCNFCGEDVFRYPSQAATEHVYCSKKCLYAYREMYQRKTEKCFFCKKEFTKRLSNFNGEKSFCTRKCKDEWQKEGLKGKNGTFFGKTHKKESLKKISDTKKFQGLRLNKSPNYRRIPVSCDYCKKTTYKTPYLVERSKLRFCSDDCRNKGTAHLKAGSSNPNYNPHLTEEDRKKRNKVLGYTKFINDVRKRDNFKCIICANSDKIVVHHLNGYHWDINNRLNIDNAVVLCEYCHKTFHSIYGQRNNIKEQFNEYYQTSTR